MTKLALLFFALVSLSAHAAKDAIYCKVDNKVYHARSEKGFYVCAESLMKGEACFTGTREGVIEMINEGGFDWGGEEWLEGARILGRDSVSYVWVDGPNELRENLVLPRCKDGFFGRNR